MMETIPLIGTVGVEFLTDALTTMIPQQAIHLIQEKGAVEQKECSSLIDLLDQLGVSRLEAHRYITQEATKRLVKRIKDKLAKKGEFSKIEALLTASFPFLGISDLRMVPIAAMEVMPAVPPQYLRQLALDNDVFEQLPQNVKQQVWEFDKKLLQKHVGEQIEAYKCETATAMQALDMSNPLGSASSGGDAAPRSQLSRKNLRNASAALQQLKAIVGESPKLYKLTVELMAAKLRDSDSLYCGVQQDMLCAARAQLAMLLHDSGVSMSGRDPCHQLTWTLDAAIQQRSISERHIQNFQKVFLTLESSARVHVSSSHRRRTQREDDDDDAESQGGDESMVGADTGKVLGDAGMVLHNPPAINLLLHHVVNRITAAADTMGLPANDPQVVLLTRMLQLASECRQMLRDQRFQFPDASHALLRSLYPALAGYLVDATARKEGMQVPPASPHETHVLDVLYTSEPGRKITMAMALQRLDVGDLDTTSILVQAVGQVLRRSSKAAHEMGPFAATLASRLAALVASGQLEVSHPLWGQCVEGVLLKCVDADTQVHEEVLRLLLACAPKLELTQLGGYLQQALDNSRKSRNRYKKRKHQAPDLMAGYSSGGWLGMDASDIGSDRADRVMATKQKEADGVRNVYQMFADRVKGLNEETAAALFAYLRSEKSEGR